MSDARYTTAFAHLILAGSSAWTYRLLNTAGHFKWAYGTLGLFLIKSCVGIVRFGHPELGGSLRNVYEHTLFLSTTFALPCVATELYLYHSYAWETAVLHAASGLLPVLADLINSHTRREWQRIIIALNTVSLTYLGYVQENYYAIATALSYGMNFFAIRTVGHHGDVPCLDLFLIGLCFFNYFTYKALRF